MPSRIVVLLKQIKGIIKDYLMYLIIFSVSIFTLLKIILRSLYLNI